MNNVAMVGPVGFRQFTLAKICEANQGHYHNYPHVTLRMDGSVDAQVLTGDEGDKIASVFELRGHDGSRVARCGDIIIRRVLPGDKLLVGQDSGCFCNSPGGSLICEWEQGGNPQQRVRDLSAGDHFRVLAGTSLSLPSNVAGHLTLISTGKIDLPDTNHGGDWCYIAANKRHRIKAQADQSAYACIFAFRDARGMVVQFYNGNAAALA